jgi:hypothetical protein
MQKSELQMQRRWLLDSNDGGEIKIAEYSRSRTHSIDVLGLDLVFDCCGGLQRTEVSTTMFKGPTVPSTPYPMDNVVHTVQVCIN